MTVRKIRSFKREIRFKLIGLVATTDERHTFSYQLLAQYAAELFSTNPDYAHITLRHFASYKAFCSSRNIRPFPILEITLALAIVNYGFPSPHLHSGAVRALAKVQARTSAPWLDIRLAAVDSRSGARSAINEVHKFIRGDFSIPKHRPFFRPPADFSTGAAVPGWSPSNTTNKHRLANLEVKPCSLTARFENGEVRELSVPARECFFRLFSCLSDQNSTHLQCRKTSALQQQAFRHLSLRQLPIPKSPAPRFRSKRHNPLHLSANK